MVEPRRGEVWWADFPAPRGSEPGNRRPVLVVQDDLFNRSRLRTILVAPFSTNLSRAEAPGNVYVAPSESGLPQPSVLLVTQVHTLDRQFFLEVVSQLPPVAQDEVDRGLRLALGLW